MVDDSKANTLGEELVRQDVITREELAKARAREAETGTPWYSQLLQGGKLNFSRPRRFPQTRIPPEVRPRRTRDPRPDTRQNEDACPMPS